MMIDRLIEGIDKKQTPLCLGIDPKISNIPLDIIEKYKYSGELGHALAIKEWYSSIIESSKDDVASVKFQIAYFELVPSAFEYALKPMIKMAKSDGIIVRIDGKLGDIDRTSDAYARAWLTPENYNADSITINHLMGTDCTDPFIEQCILHDSGIIPTVYTSNKSKKDYMGRLTEVDPAQKILLEEIGIELVDGKYTPLYNLLALAVRKYAEDPRLMGKYGYSNIGAVVGATVEKNIIDELRLIMPNSYFLMPGIGSSQGGDTRKKITNALTAADENGRGLTVPLSSNITDIDDTEMNQFDSLDIISDRVQFFKEEINEGLAAAGKLPKAWKI